jgi:hypothetical protein
MITEKIFFIPPAPPHDLGGVARAVIAGDVAFVQRLTESGWTGEALPPELDLDAAPARHDLAALRELNGRKTP